MEMVPLGVRAVPVRDHATYVPCHLLKVAPVPKKNTIGQLAKVFSV